MHAEFHDEPSRRDYSSPSRLQYYAGVASSIVADAVLKLRREPRARWILAGGVGVILILAYVGSESPPEAMASSPSLPVLEKASQAPLTSVVEIEGLKATITQQNATNQMLVTAIDELRAEQQKLRRDVAALQAAKQTAVTAGSAGVTGSIGPRPQPKTAPAKRADQSDARQVPYPAPEARHVPYPKPN
jgi:hypothetical protein